MKKTNNNNNSAVIKSAPANPRAMQWCYTLNNPKQPIEFNELTMTYLVYGEEVGEELTPHHQGFIVFKNRKTLSQLKELNNRAHWEVMKGNTKQAADYCKKDGVFHEFGAAPEDKHAKAGKQQQDKWRRISDLAKKGDLDSIDAEHPKAFVGSYRNLKQLKVDYMVQCPDLEKPCGVWLYGEAGAGKSQRARKLYPGSYPKACNKWWDGYQQEEYVLIDDFDKRHEVLSHYLKIWSDKYGYLGETKGGTVVCRPQVVCVTSQYSIDDIWEDKETRDALKRRFKEILVERSEWDNPIARAMKAKELVAKAKAADEIIEKKHEVLSVSDYEKMPKKIQPTNVYFPDPALKFSGMKRGREELTKSSRALPAIIIDEVYSEAINRLNEYRGVCSTSDFKYFSTLPQMYKPNKFVCVPCEILDSEQLEEEYLKSGDTRRKLMEAYANVEVTYKSVVTANPIHPLIPAMRKRMDVWKKTLIVFDEEQKQLEESNIIDLSVDKTPVIVYESEDDMDQDAADGFDPVEYSSMPVPGSPLEFHSPPASPDVGEEIPTQIVKVGSVDFE